MKRLNINLILALGVSTALFACSGADSAEQNTATAQPAEIYTPKPKANPNGVGPVADLQLEAFNAELAAEGEGIFTTNCTACHKMDKRHVGPALGGVLNRRQPAWVMNMILNPENMVKEDPAAKELLAEYLSPMANQNLSQEQARAVVEYFRKYDQENPQ